MRRRRTEKYLRRWSASITGAASSGAAGPRPASLTKLATWSGLIARSFLRARARTPPHSGRRRPGWSAARPTRSVDRRGGRRPLDRRLEWPLGAEVAARSGTPRRRVGSVDGTNTPQEYCADQAASQESLSCAAALQ